MRLSTERVQELQQLLKAEFGLEYDHEQAQQAGLAIMRFVISKHRLDALQEEKDDGKSIQRARVRNGQAITKGPGDIQSNILS